MTKKDPRNKIGDVYALHTIYGDCLMQIADVRYLEIGKVYRYVCRVFKTRYEKLPDNIAEIIRGDHDFIVRMGDPPWLLKKAPKDALYSDYSKELKMRGIEDNRTKCATLVGKFDVPAWFKTPARHKRVSKSHCIPRDDSPWPPLEHWYLSFENPDKNSCMPYSSISLYDWITKELKMDIYSDEWHPYFVELGPGSIIDTDIIQMLEDDFSLDMWLPCDFPWKNKKYFQPTKEWAQLMREEEEREREWQERNRIREEKRERLKAQGTEFNFRKTQKYKDFIKLVKE
jgi:hypothetical protein